jgi:ABC-2 type transport system ATP-binding protein
VSAAATLDGVTMRFRGHTALTDVSTQVQADTITGLLGRNGAGKTTMMQLLTGHRVPSAGQVRVFGQAPYENDAVLSRLCFIKESQRYPDHFRVCDAVSAAASVFPQWDAELAAQLVDDFELPMRRAVKKLSRGMTSAVGIVLGLASRAPVTLFDEPYLGLDAVARQLFYDRLLTDYAEHPRTIVLSTHLIEEISDLLEHVLLIDRGRVLLDADAETLRATALTVSGPTRQVSTFGAAHQLLRIESLAGRSRAVVRTDDATSRRMATDLGLTVEATTLQQLVVAMSHASGASASAPTTVPSDLQGVDR